MKRIPRDPEKHEVLALFNSIGKKKNLKLQDKDSEKAFLDSVSASLARHKETPILLHGHRIEAMFGFILGSLGECLFIKQEDARETYSRITQIKNRVREQLFLILAVIALCPLLFLSFHQGSEFHASRVLSS